jgi:hypothetical protein
MAEEPLSKPKACGTSRLATIEHQASRGSEPGLEAAAEAMHRCPCPCPSICYFNMTLSTLACCHCSPPTMSRGEREAGKRSWAGDFMHLLYTAAFPR